MLAEEACTKATIKNDHTELLPKTLLAKTVAQSFRTEMLAEKASAKTTNKKDCYEMLPKNYPQKQLFKLSETKF